MKIAHIADIHIRKSVQRHDEYRTVFKNLYKSLLLQKPDIIVLVGDLFHEGIKFESEQLVLAAEFINKLAKIAPVRITRGNHDIVKYSLKRVDAIEALIKTIDNSDVIYYNETGFYEEPVNDGGDEIVWAVWKHAEKNNSPWIKKGFKRIEGKTYIDLFHDPVVGSKNSDGYEFKGKTYRLSTEFKGDISMFGDIHLHQAFYDTKAYSSSLIAQTFSEGDDQFHGYLLWDNETRTFEKIEVLNEYSFKNVVITRFTNFDGLDFEIENSTKHMRLRVIWRTYPADKNTENERRVVKYLTDKYDPVFIKHKAEFVEEDTVELERKADIFNLNQKDVVHGIIRDYLTKIGAEEDLITDVIGLDEEIEARISVDDINNIQWSILRFSGTNFRSFKSLEIDWADKQGIFQISGKNTAGKSSIIQLISYVLYGKTLETDYKKKFKDAAFINNVIKTDFCEGAVVLECSGEYYGIKRKTQTKKNKVGELTEAKTLVWYYKLATSTDELTDENCLEKLNEEERRTTQKRIDEIIGSYDNFIRIILTTADNLNSILSNDRAVFIDSLLADAGLNVFDQRLEAFKTYKKEVIALNKITCDVNKELGNISILENTIAESQTKIAELKAQVAEFDERIKKGEEYKEELAKKFHNITIDSSITEESLNKELKTVEHAIIDIHSEQDSLERSMRGLKESFDEALLTSLTQQKESHLGQQYELKHQITTHQSGIERFNSQIHKINNDVLLMKRDGTSKKEEVAKLEKEKICSRCGQDVKEESLATIRGNVETLKLQMIALGAAIVKKEAEKIPLEEMIKNYQEVIQTNEQKVTEKDVEFSSILLQMGELKTQENEVKRRTELANKLNVIPLKLENKKYEKAAIENRIKEYLTQKDKIGENKKIQVIIDASNTKINGLKGEKRNVEVGVNDGITQNKIYESQIAAKNGLILKFKEQERRERVYDLYVNCVHRDGIPTQILTTVLLPRINEQLNSLLANVDFNVWLDAEELRPKLSYVTRPNSIIDCIGSSGKERTFSALSMKTALNEINAKSKPTMSIYDEITGKLAEESVDDFVDFLQSIKKKTSKILIIEHNHDLAPDFVINVEKNGEGISTLTLN